MRGVTLSPSWAVSELILVPLFTLIINPRRSLKKIAALNLAQNVQRFVLNLVGEFYSLFTCTAVKDLKTILLNIF